MVLTMAGTGMMVETIAKTLLVLSKANAAVPCCTDFFHTCTLV